MLCQKIQNLLKLNRGCTSLRYYAPRRRTPRVETANPGIDKRLRHFEDDIKRFHDDPEEFESIEADFMNLNTTHHLHEKQLARMKDRNYQLMIGRKYFKTKTPNFLTYNEKEQIKDLNSRDPEEWTVEKLSEAFPADPYTIGLILRSKWQPRDTNRITKHDESVKRNWNDFKNGKLDVDPILAEHLKKFAFRDFDKLTRPPANRKLGVEVPKPKNQEFVGIILSGIKNQEERPNKAIRKIESEETKISNERPSGDADTFVLSGKKEISSKNTTLEQLQKKYPQMALKETSVSAAKLPENEIPSLKVSKIKETNSEVALFVKSTENAIESLQINRRIRIPQKLRKKGKLYRVEDCFYDDDGDFLYRVPGLFKS